MRINCIFSTNCISQRDEIISFSLQNDFITPTVLEKALKSSKERLERKLGLSFIVSVTDKCAAEPCPFNKKCVSVVKPDQRTVKQGYACLCLDGSKGL